MVVLDVVGVVLVVGLWLGDGGEWLDVDVVVLVEG